MVEYLIKVECEAGIFMVTAGLSKTFAQKMFDTFTLRDKDNQNIPHSKHLVEMHAEEKDLGAKGPVEILDKDSSFDDYLESHRREMLPQQIQEAEAKVTEAIRIKRSQD